MCMCKMLHCDSQLPHMRFVCFVIFVLLPVSLPFVRCRRTLLRFSHQLRDLNSLILSMLSLLLLPQYVLHRSEFSICAMWYLVYVHVVVVIFSSRARARINCYRHHLNMCLPPACIIKLLLRIFRERLSIHAIWKYIEWKKKKKLPAFLEACEWLLFVWFAAVNINDM